ncbi:hypothetical protein CWE02_19230 [Brucella pituitosa]|nr:hypothetical protein CWE02_19230 [Brucella pituitosa]
MQERHQTWTPDLVGKALIEAVRFCMITGGPHGPARIRNSMPELAMTLTDRLGAGWRSVDTNVPVKKRRRYSPQEVSFFDKAIQWPIDYLPDQDGQARVLQLWLRCKITRVRFADEVACKGWSRATAYRQRDRALSTISVGLDSARMPIWTE